MAKQTFRLGALQNEICVIFSVSPYNIFSIVSHITGLIFMPVHQFNIGLLWCAKCLWKCIRADMYLHVIREAACLRVEVRRYFRVPENQGGILASCFADKRILSLARTTQHDNRCQVCKLASLP